MLRSLFALIWMCAAVLLVPAVVGLLAVKRHAHLAETEDTTRRVRVAVAATAVGLGALGVAALLGAGPVSASVTAAVLAVAVLLWAPLSRYWAVRGAVTWALLVTAVLAFMAWLLHRILQSSLAPGELVLSGLGWALLLLAAVGLRRHVWERVAAHAETRPGSPRPQPGGRQVIALAAVLAAGTVAVVGTSSGLENDEPARRTAAPDPPDSAGTPPRSALTPPSPLAPTITGKVSTPPAGPNGAAAGIGHAIPPQTYGGTPSGLTSAPRPEGTRDVPRLAGSRKFASPPERPAGRTDGGRRRAPADAMTPPAKPHRPSTDSTPDQRPDRARGRDEEPRPQVRDLPHGPRPLLPTAPQPTVPEVAGPEPTPPERDAGEGDFERWSPSIPSDTGRTGPGPGRADERGWGGGRNEPEEEALPPGLERKWGVMPEDAPVTTDLPGY